MKSMKKILVAALFIPFTFSAQKLEVPAAVNATFTNEYKALEGNPTIVWELLNDRYVVRFSSEDKKSEIIYDASGLKLESLVEVSKERLSHQHLDYIKENHKNAKVSHVYLQSSEVAPVRFVVDVVKSGATSRLFFRPDGTFFEEVKL